MIFRGKFQVLGLAAILAVFVSADVLMAQPGGRGGRGGGDQGGGGMFGQVNNLSLLGQEGVQSELELVEDQVESIKKAQEDARDQMREMFMGMRDELQGLGDDERREKFEEMREKMTEMNAELEKDAMADLLPHQVDRLKQLLVQAQTRRNGGATSGRMSSVLIEELGLTEAQEEELKEKAEEVAKKMNEKIAKIRGQAQEEIFSSVLSKEQYAKYKEMVGDAYDFDANRTQRGGADRGGADRGGRGGADRGGRGGGDRGGRGGGDRGGNTTERESDFN